MIFNNNTTSLSSNIAMAEGYDGSCGAALALIESARNEYAMFRAMLDIDARELQIQRESAGYVNEGELMALTESTISGIWNKIKELCKKLIAKVKSIFHVFMSKIDSLNKSDKQMVKKYGKEINRKTNIGNLEVKWIKFKDNFTNTVLGEIPEFTTAYIGGNGNAAVTWKEESDERELEFAKKLKVTDMDSFEEDLDDLYADGGTEDTYQIKDSEVGGIGNILRYLDGYDKHLRDLNKSCRTLTNKVEKLVRDVDKEASTASKQFISNNGNEYNNGASAKHHTLKRNATSNAWEVGDEERRDGNSAAVKAGSGDVEWANKAYDMAVAYQNVILRTTRWVLDTDKKQYKQNKAAFMKAIAANNKKLEESAVYLDAIAEAAEEEVENVISGALSKEELSKICNASLNVKDADVSDDPDRLTYGPDSYTDNLSYVRTDGSIDTDINSKSESAFFGQLLY